MFLRNLYELITYDIDELYYDLFENKENFTIKKKRYYNIELKKILDIYHKIWKKELKKLVEDFKNKKHKNFKTFFLFISHNFNETLRLIGDALQDNNLDKEWVSVFTHWAQEKMIMTSGIVEKMAENELFFKKQRMIQILNFYKMMVCFMEDDIKYLHKEKINKIIKLEKKDLYDYDYLKKN